MDSYDMKSILYGVHSGVGDIATACYSSTGTIAPLHTCRPARYEVSLQAPPTIFQSVSE